MILPYITGRKLINPRDVATRSIVVAISLDFILFAASLLPTMWRRARMGRALREIMPLPAAGARPQTARMPYFPTQALCRHSRRRGKNPLPMPRSQQAGAGV